MRVLLDTCAVIWCVSAPERLSERARVVLQDTDSQIFVSVISCAEVACLSDAGKITVTPHWRTWFSNALDDNGWSILDIDLETVQEAFSLPGDFHRDPADRLITAAARLHRMAVLTADQKLLDYPHVQSVW